MKRKKRNRHGLKGMENENRTGAPETGYTKLDENPRNLPTENASTAGNTANSKWSRTGMRKDEKEESEIRNRENS
jgi:hypothetical protein